MKKIQNTVDRGAYVGRVGWVGERVDSALILLSKRILYYDLDPMSKSIRKAGRFWGRPDAGGFPPSFIKYQ